MVRDDTNARRKAERMDNCWLTVRLLPRKLFEVDLERDPLLQKLPGWSGFNSVVSLRVANLTTIGYYPIFPASPTEYSTIYTVMKTAQKICRNLGQDFTIITFDEAIYSKRKEIL